MGMLRRCGAPGCEVLTLGERCCEHDAAAPSGGIAVWPAVPRAGFTRRRIAAADLSFCKGSLQLAPTGRCDPVSEE
jgi:hypothetical protein